MKSMSLQLISERIIVSPDKYTVPEDTTRAVIELTESAKEIETVVTAEQNRIAGQVVTRIRQTVKDIKAVRVMLSKPLDDAKDRLIEMERAATDPLEAERVRIETLGKAFIEAENRRVADEEKKRADEIARLESERVAKEQAIERERQEAERKRQEQERRAAEEAAKIKNKAKREAFEKEQKRFAEEQSKRDKEAEQERIEQANAAEIASRRAIVAPLPEVQRTRGQTGKQYPRHKVLDIHAVYAARRELCAIEIRASVVNAICVAKSGSTELNPDTETVPGLALWSEFKAIYVNR